MSSKRFPEVTGFECNENTRDWCNMTLEFDASVPKFLILDIVQRAIKGTLVGAIRGIGAYKVI